MSAPCATRIYDDATLTLYKQDNLLVASWCAAPSPEQIQRVGDQLLGLSKTFGHDVGFANLIVRAKVEHSTPQAREGAQQLLKRFRQNRCFAHVVLEPGLAGVLVRTVLRTIGLAGPNRASFRVFDSTRDASVWIAGQFSDSPTRAWLSSEVLALLNFASASPSTETAASQR